MHPASKSPRKNRHASSPAKLWHAAMHVSARPHPRISVGMRIRCGTLTISQAEKGCQASWAMGAMEPMREYSCPERFASSWRSKTAPVPRTALSRT